MIESGISDAPSTGTGFSGTGDAAGHGSAGRGQEPRPDPGSTAVVMGLRMAGALLLVICGWLAGDAVQTGCRAHVQALRWAIWLVQRLRQEIAYRQADRELLYRLLCQEDPALSGQGGLSQLPLPSSLTGEEQTLLRECLSGIGHAAAQQECERLDYYQLRFEKILVEAEQKEQARAVRPTVWEPLPERCWLCGSCEQGAVFRLEWLKGKSWKNKGDGFPWRSIWYSKLRRLGIIVAVLNQLLIRSGGTNQAMMTTLAGLVVVLSMLVQQISALFVTIQVLV